MFRLGLGLGLGVGFRERGKRWRYGVLNNETYMT